MIETLPLLLFVLPVFHFEMVETPILSPGPSRQHRGITEWKSIVLHTATTTAGLHPPASVS